MNLNRTMRTFQLWASEHKLKLDRIMVPIVSLRWLTIEPSSYRAPRPAKYRYRLGRVSSFIISLCRRMD